MRITAGDTKTEEYKKMNPLCKVEYLIYTSYVRYARWIGNSDTDIWDTSSQIANVQVPVLKDGDFVLTESVAMLRYLAREKQVGFNLIRVPDHLNAQRVGWLGIGEPGCVNCCP